MMSDCGMISGCDALTSASPVFAEFSKYRVTLMAVPEFAASAGPHQSPRRLSAATWSMCRWTERYVLEPDLKLFE
jgi:hypothetical protein